MTSLWRRLRWWLLGGLLLLLLLSRAAWWWTDFLWFRSLGQTVVFSRLLAAKAALLLCVCGAAALLWMVPFRQSLRRDLPPAWAHGDSLTWSVLLWRLLPVVIPVACLLVGLGATALWPALLLKLNAVPAGTLDPLFGRDVSWYMTDLPFWLALQRKLFGLAVIGWVALYLRYVELPQATEELTLRAPRAVAPPARAHLAGYGVVVFLLWAWGFWLGRFALLVTARTGVLHGAAYTDERIRLPMLGFMTIAAVVAAVWCVLAARRACLRTVGWTVGSFAGLLLLSGLVPAVVQRLVVAPNESEREAPYIARCIAATRQALGLEAAEVRGYDVAGRLDPAELSGYDEVLSTVPLWSPPEMSEQIVSTETLRSYYNFGVIDYDRYQLDGRTEQVALMVREMQSDRLDARARTWVNRHLVYTHGYGLVMASAHAIEEAGRPSLLVGDIPPVPPDDLPLARPEIYYGELPSNYIITGLPAEAATREFDYPAGDRNVTCAYTGTGGVPLGGLFRRLAFAWRFRIINLLVSDLLDRDSRVHWRRDLMSRVQTLAPFLAFDSDPYPAVVGGRIVWIADAYTLSATYPYSRPHPLMPAAALADPQGERLRQGDAAYARNSVKVVVDAYDGTVTLYRVDQNCPLAAAWAAAFPGLFTDSTPPAELAAHFRYPPDLFTLQARAYARFHMTAPDVFYNAEDLWDLAREETTVRTVRPDGSYEFTSARERMVPYYVLLRLPGEEQARFRLIVPFTPAGGSAEVTGRDNMIGWMAADCDPGSYGRLTVFHFPKSKLIWGPLLVEAQIDQDPDISQQITLWGEQGSRVLRGRLLVVPLGDSLLFVEPLFITAERRGALPELKRVVVVYDGVVRMAETLDEALNAVLTGRRSSTGAAELLRLRQSAQAARNAWRQAEERRRAGDLVGYGQSLAELSRVLESMSQGAAAD